MLVAAIESGRDVSIAGDCARQPKTGVSDVGCVTEFVRGADTSAVLTRLRGHAHQRLLQVDPNDR